MTPLRKDQIQSKPILPAVFLNDSKEIQNLYSKPIYGKNEKFQSLNFDSPMAWVPQFDKNGKVRDPYKLLPPLFEGIGREI